VCTERVLSASLWLVATYTNTGDDGPDPVLEDLAETEDWIAAGAPSLSTLWAERHGVEPTSPPLTVKQAATAANVSERTIRRRLPELEALDPPGARKIGRIWRIRADALDALATVRTAEKTVERRRRRSRTASAPTSTRWEA
jgi:hypothetical protein